MTKRERKIDRIMKAVIRERYGCDPGDEGVACVAAGGHTWLGHSQVAPGLLEAFRSAYAARS